MALGTQFDLLYARGDDRSITATIVDEAGTVVNITGAAITYAVFLKDASDTAPRPQPLNGGTALFSKTVGSGIVITDAVNGAIRIDLSSADTVGLVAPKDYYQEIQTVLTSKTTTVMYGTLSLARDGINPGP